MACSSEKTKQHWKDRILNQRNSGLSVAAWCRQNKVSDHLFYYWQNKLFPKAALSHSSFVELKNDERTIPSNITLTYKEFSIHLGHHFDASTLKQCLEVLKQC